MEVVIRNTGLPIQNVSVHLEFIRHRPDGRASNAAVAMGMPMQGAFDYGALGQFEFKLAHPIPMNQRIVGEWLSCFAGQSPTETRPRIVIRSGEFNVVSINLVSRFDWLVRCWNRVAIRINHLFDCSGTYVDGQKWIRDGKVLPVLGMNAWFHLQSVGRIMSDELSDGKGGE